LSLCADMMPPWDLKALITQQADEITALRARVEELEEALRNIRPRPIEEAPKDREVIGVERPPGEDRNFYRMVKWDDEKSAWVTQIDIDWSVHPGRIVYAVCHGMSHFIHPDAVPLIPEEDVEEHGDDE
jgi:hypothetical protein